MKNYIKSVFLLVLLVAGNLLHAQTAVEPATNPGTPTTGGPCPDINVSTAIDNAGGSIAVGAVDPNWVIVAGPTGPAAAKRVTSFFSWQPTPIAGTNAGWLNQTGTIYGNIPGTYIFERAFTVAPGTTSFACNFGVGWANQLVSLELIPPSGPPIALGVPPTPAYQLSAPIGYVQGSPAAGVWRIRARVIFSNETGGFLLSGYIDLNCGDNPCNCENIHPTFTYSTNADCITTFIAQINSNCLGTAVQYDWYVNGVPSGSGPTWSYAFATNGTYIVCLRVTLTTASGQTCVREFCREIVIDCNPCSCDLLKPDFTYTFDKCVGYFTGNAEIPCCMTNATYDWFVNGNPVGSGTNFNYTFPNNGYYNVCVYVTTTLPDGTQCHKEICKIVEVKDCSPCNCDQLQVNIDYQLDRCVGTFYGSAYGPDCMTNFTYQWYVNGNPVGGGPVMTYTFPSNGSYNVCLFVTVTLPDGTQCHKEVCKVINVKDCDPCNCDQLQVVYDYYLNKCEGHFFGYATGPECMQNYQYTWYVNGVPVSSGINFDYVFPGNGVYNVCLFVTVTLPNGQECHKEFCRLIEVKDCDPCNCDLLQVGFEYQMDKCTGYFYGWAMGPECMQNYTWQWYVNGVPAGNTQNMNYTFTGNGIYTICLYVTVTLPNGLTCQKEYCYTIEVNCEPCNCEQLQVSYQYGIDKCVGSFYSSVQLPPCAVSLGYQWTVNGSPVPGGTGPNLTYTFPGNGTYYVCVFVSVVLPDGTKCEREYCRYVTITDCQPCNCDQLSVSYQYSIQNCTGYFNASATIPPCAVSVNYQWYVNGVPTATGNPFTYSFPGSGGYNVCVVVSVVLPDGTKCERQYCREVGVECQPCNCSMLGGSFNAQVNGCVIQLQAQPIVPACMTNVGFTWTVNGAYAGSGPVLSYAVPANGSYTVCLRITAIMPNGQKCEKIICKKIVVKYCGIIISPTGMAPAPPTAEETVILYPNPADDVINIDFTTAEDGPVTITFKTADGKEVLTQTKETEAGDQHFEIEIPAGVVDEMIFVEITTTTEQIVRKVSVSRR